MQRNSFESVRARASSAGSERISSGSTASAGGKASSVSNATIRQSHLIWFYSAGESAALLRAGFGAPTRRRRSESDSAPPTTITTAPNQMSSTKGL
jgi:hypothetical protein